MIHIRQCQSRIKGPHDQCIAVSLQLYFKNICDKFTKLGECDICRI